MTVCNIGALQSIMHVISMYCTLAVSYSSVLAALCQELLLGNTPSASISVRFFTTSLAFLPRLHLLLSSFLFVLSFNPKSLFLLSFSFSTSKHQRIIYCYGRKSTTNVHNFTIIFAFNFKSEAKTLHSIFANAYACTTHSHQSRWSLQTLRIWLLQCQCRYPPLVINDLNDTVVLMQ